MEVVTAEVTEEKIGEVMTIGEPHPGSCLLLEKIVVLLLAQGMTHLNAEILHQNSNSNNNQRMDGPLLPNVNFNVICVLVVLKYTLQLCGQRFDNSFRYTMYVFFELHIIWRKFSRLYI